MLLKKKETDAFDIDELQEKLRDEEEKRRFFLIAIRALLVFVRDFSLDLKEIDSDGFRKGIDDLTEKFISGEKAKTIRSFFEKHKKTIVSFINRQKIYLHDREKELKDIIALLTKAMTTLDAENRDYNEKIYKQTDKIEQITLLDDIKKIKNALSNEIERMRVTVKEKQAHEKKRIETLSNKVSSLNVELEKAKEESLKDGLTGIYNRKTFDSHIRNLVERNTVKHLPFSMLMLDIDDFKEINDTYGHSIGDRVIMAVVHKCRESTRSHDFFARYGGDEFVIVLPGISFRNALKKAKQLSKSIAESRYSLSELRDGNKLSFTVSIGMATYRKGDSAETTAGRADRALYAAKHSGKNRVISEKDL